MRTLYSKFVWMTLLIMFLSGSLGFIIVNTYYHQNLKVENDSKNVLVAKSMVKLIETTEQNDLEPILNAF
jgi:hypothetical protein